MAQSGNLLNLDQMIRKAHEFYPPHNNIENILDSPKYCDSIHQLKSQANIRLMTYIHTSSIS